MPPTVRDCTRGDKEWSEVLIALSERTKLVRIKKIEIDKNKIKDLTDKRYVLYIATFQKM